MTRRAWIALSVLITAAVLANVANFVLLAHNDPDAIPWLVGTVAVAVAAVVYIVWEQRG